MQMFSRLNVCFLAVTLLLAGSTMDVHAQEASLTIGSFQNTVYVFGDAVTVDFFAELDGAPVPGVQLIIIYNGLTDVTVSNGGITDFLGSVTVTGIVQATEGYIEAIWKEEERDKTARASFNAIAVNEPPKAKAATLAIVSGFGQMGAPGTRLKPFVVEMRDQYGSLFSGATVNFRVEAGGGTLSWTTTTTNNLGQASTTLTLGSEAGENRVVASVVGVELSQIFIAIAIAADEPLKATTLAIVSGNYQTGESGASLSQPFVVGVLDQNQQPMRGISVTFRVIAGGGRLIGRSPIDTDEYGQARITLTLGSVGLNRVEASVRDLSKLTFTATATAPQPPPEPPKPTTLAIVSGNNQIGESRADLSQPFVVGVLDQNQKPIQDQAISVTFRVTAGDGRLTGQRIQTIKTDEYGQARITLTLGSVGMNQVKATVPGLTAQTFSATAEATEEPEPEPEPSKATTLAIVSGNNQTGESGADLSQPFVVGVLDQNQQPMRGISVTFRVIAGDGRLIGRTSQTIIDTDEYGQARITLTLGSKTGEYRVVASVVGIELSQTFIANGVYVGINPATIVVNPPNPKSPLKVGDTFTQTIEIQNTTDLAGWQMDIAFNPEVLEVIDISGGDFLGQNETDAFFSYELSPDKISVKQVRLGAASGVSGSGVLVELTFRFMSFSEALLGLHNVRLSDSSGERLSYAVTLTPVVATHTSVAAEDVNQDGQVDILDLITVAGSIGAAKPNLRADVNDDGIVDVLDLVAIASSPHWGRSVGIIKVREPNAAAPAASVLPPTPETIREWITLARLKSDGSLPFQRGIANLESLLASRIPSETRLLLNYPNPFNPETWIPYQLSEASDVTVSIYAVDGRLIRTLALGHQSAGLYQRKNRAAYWDGRNEFGEPVASDVYFYTLTAGNFTATGKMLVRK